MFGDYFVGKKLITFDLDGTIIKSESTWDAAFKKVMELNGWVWTSAGQYGASVRERWERVLAENKLEKARPITELVELTHTEFINQLSQLVVTDGFWPFAAELKFKHKLPLALVTNTARVVTDKVVAYLEFGKVFDFVICGDEVKNPKPAPDIYKKTLDHFKIPAKNTLAFEDSLVGAASAAKAGISIILVWDGVTSVRKYPDEVIGYTDSFAPLPGNIDTTHYADIIKQVKELETEPQP